MSYILCIININNNVNNMLFMYYILLYIMYNLYVIYINNEIIVLLFIKLRPGGYKRFVTWLVSDGTGHLSASDFFTSWLFLTPP